MNANTYTAETVVLPEGITEGYSLRAVYAALLNGFTGTPKELLAVIGEGHIASGVAAALKALKGAGLADGVKVDPASNFSPAIWSLTTPAIKTVAEAGAAWLDANAPGWVDAISEDALTDGVNETRTIVDDVADRDAAFAEALADVMGDDDTDGEAGPDLLNELLNLDVPTPARAPRKNARGEVRLLAAYRNDPAPRERTTAGNGKQMGPILAFLMENAGTEFTVREIEKALGLPDYPSAATERLAADESTGVRRIDFVVEGQKKSRKKFVYVAPAAAE